MGGELGILLKNPLIRMTNRLSDRLHTASPPVSPGFRSNPFAGKLSIFGFLFGLPFFAAGLFFCWIGGLQPLVKVVQSSSWPQVPCQITSSGLESHTSDGSTTYQVAIQFRYSYESRDFTGGAYDFSSGASSGRSGKQRIVARYPVGAEALCRVNPANPEEAVLSRDIPGMVWFAIPFSSIFILVGLGIMAASLGLIPEKWAAKVRSRHKPVTRESAGNTELKPKVGKKGKLLGMLFIAVFWNGIVSVFVWQVIDGFRDGRPEWFLLFFMIPFVLVGIGFICGVVYYLLALANPTFILALSEGNPRLGETITLDWRASGFLGRLDSLSLVLEGQEAATYRRGTRSVTDHSLFHSESLFQTDQPGAHPGGQLSIRIPDDSMHSFDGGNNKIEWAFRIRGSIRRWPDVDERFPVTIRPLHLK